MEDNLIYLDYNATTPIDPEVAAAMKPYLESYFGNPSSNHKYGRETRQAIEKAREQIAHLINCKASEIIFTSGGTESNNFSIKGIAHKNRALGKHIITSAIEHPAVLEVCKYLEGEGFEITIVPVDETGLIQMDKLKEAIRPDTILISVMHANNEVGTIQPIAEIGKIAKEKNIVFHCDAAQSIGKIPVDVQEMQVDLLSIAGHKLYAPKGIGALYIRQGIQLEKLIHGADHERNLRAGTENVLEIVGLGKAAELAKLHLAQSMSDMEKLRSDFIKALSNSYLQFHVNGHPEKHLLNTASISFRNIEANTLLSELKGIAASAGAACHAENVTVSSVLQAMVIPMDYAMGTIRFSFGRFSTKEEVNRAAGQIVETVQKLQGNESNKLEEKILHKDIKLTEFTHGLGCACKLSPKLLDEILEKLPVAHHPDILVSTENSDDCAVYRINDDTALVQTLDFFTPVVDDPYLFGAIATANALSDIYAMGAKPLFALNIVAFPGFRLPMSVLEDILRGASDKLSEAGIFALGGHSIEDNEPKFGQVVSGIAHPDKILKNTGAQPGDCILLTKAIGTGILSTALKREVLSVNTKNALHESMLELNKTAAELLSSYPVHACTDVSGFGLLGHLYEMLKASKVNAELDYNSIPLLPDVENVAMQGHIPGGTKSNLKWLDKVIQFDPVISEIEQFIAADAQTSGGLLIALPEKEARDLVVQLHEKGIIQTSLIGRIVSQGTGSIQVKK